MRVSRRQGGTYPAGGYLLRLLIALTLLAVCIPVSAALKTEVISPRVFTTMSPDGGMKMVRDEAVAGQVLIELQPGVTAAQFDALLAKHQATVLRAIPRFNQFVVSLPEGTSVLEGRQMWAAEAQVKLAEPDKLMYLAYTPNDTLYGQQYQWPLTLAEAAWDVQQGSLTTTIAIIDSGYDADHEDLIGKWWTNTDEFVDGSDSDGNGYIDDTVGWDFVADDNDPDAGPVGTEPYEPGQVSHGMHCAGLAGAVSDNGIGVAGYDWSARMMPLRVFPPEGPSPSGAINQAIAYAIDNGADIISLSIQGGFTTAYDTPIAQAHAAGIVVVAAAGNFSVVFTNDPGTWFSPVCNDGPNLGVDNFVLGVGASDSNDIAAEFTNRDASDYRFVDVMAPGVQTWSTLYYNPAFPGLDEAFYGPMSGTSMACPITAGLAGLCRAQFPGFTPDQIVNQIRDSADDIDPLNPLYAGTLGEGRINGAGAIGLDVPPAPVTNLRAFDTPNDESKSISITWNLSLDDGNDVVSYGLMRAEENVLDPGNPGPLSLLVTLPPGTDSYTDVPVEDYYKKYWYQVVTRDAVNAVPSAVVGWAIARDDVPPDPIETLAAGDTQADNGGSISLSWYGYNYPDDLDHYNIYRGQMAFTTVSAMTPIATVGNPEVQNYEDTTTVDDTPYWYAVTGVDNDDNENVRVTAVGPVSSNPNMSFHYPAGLSIIAIGAQPATGESDALADILGIQPADGVNLAYYDTAKPEDPYVIFSEQPNSPFFDQLLGRAWWLKTEDPILLNISGQPAPAGDFELPVPVGWSLIGNPFSVAVDFADTMVTGIGQGTPVTLATSNTMGYTRDYAWAFDAFTNSYKLVSGADLDFATREIGPGRGAFFLARRAATLVLQRPVAAAALGAETEREPLDGWMLKIVAQAEGAADIDNYLGVASQAARLNDIVTPPRPDADLDLYFVRTAAEQARWATDFATEAEARSEWRMKVACAMPGATVKLTWPDLSGLPADSRPVLVDDATGRSIYLRTSTGYSYRVPEDAAERSFTLRVGERGGALAISSLAVGGAAGGAQLAYTLSADAAVDVEVLNIAGIVVRRIINGREQAAGPQQVVWDGHNGLGAPVPAGTYLVRVRARADDGQQVSAVRTVQINR